MDERKARHHKKKLNRHEDLLQAHKPEFEDLISKKMKRTDGFMAFKPSLIGGNSSNSLLPSNSGQENEVTSSTTSDQALSHKTKQFKSKQPNELKSKYKSRNKNQVICSKNTEPGVAVGSQHSSSSYLGLKTLYTTNFKDHDKSNLYIHF